MIIPSMTHFITQWTCLACVLSTTLAFSIKPTIFQSHYRKIKTSKLFMNNPLQSKQLISIFSETQSPNDIPNIPAGLRGEAVRSALCDPKKGLWYELSNPKTFQVGTMKVKGSGTLEFLHSKFTNSFDKPSLPMSFIQKQTSGIVREACFLTAKGRTIDTLSILLTHNQDQYEAHILTSPNHYSGLYDKLNPFVFPMDGIKLQDCASSISVFSILSTTLANAQAIIQRTIIPALQTTFSSSISYSLPQQREGCIWTIPDNFQNQDDNHIYIMEHGIMLPPCTARGYTILIPSHLSYIIKDSLNGNASDSLPMEISTLEWESLRIESGTPGYGNEMTGDYDSKDNDKHNYPSTIKGFKSNPLELHLKSFINLEKGCYQGQEGVSSILKNKRGTPRTLYTIIFDDDENSFHNDEDDEQLMTLENRQPVAGDELYVLGSNEKIQVGVITSVAEPGSTGKSNTIALALLRRPDSILKKMKDMELDFGADNVEDDLFYMLDEEEKSRQMEERIRKQSLLPADPLQGLEVIVKGTYTMGKVQVIPKRSIMEGKNLFDDSAIVEPITNGAVMGYVDLSRVSSESDQPSSASIHESTQQDQLLSLDEDRDDDEAIAKALEEANKAAIEAEKAAAEAKRKAEKMELLRQRAEAAMARRKKKKEQN